MRTARTALIDARLFDSRRRTQDEVGVVFDSFEAFYRSDFQSLYLLVVVPAAFLGWLLTSGPERRAGAEPAAARFVRAWALVFAVETILDPVMSGPLVRAFGLEAHAWSLLVVFVLLGDFRVFLLVFLVAEPGRGSGAATGRAVLWTLLVPAVAGGTWAFLDGARGPLPSQTLWILYEVAFLALARWLRTDWLPRHVAPERPRVRHVLGLVLDYVALYYALWAACDAVILFAGADLGWGLRAVPNQLYYSVFVPFAYASFFRAGDAPGSPRFARTAGRA